MFVIYVKTLGIPVETQLCVYMFLCTHIEKTEAISHTSDPVAWIAQPYYHTFSNDMQSVQRKHCLFYLIRLYAIFDKQCRLIKK